MTESINKASITAKPHLPWPNQREHCHGRWLWEYSVPLHNRTVSGIAVTWAVALLRVQQILAARR